MVSNNKILTVSYGTFSCTLEGFDDSFDTMKAIAEYFRDLASDDRYFGAEPPVPDAEMLARIAQREISRKVEAHEEDGGGILLRAEDVPNAALATTAAVASVASKPQPEPEAPTPVISEKQVEIESIEAPAPEQPVDPAVTFFEAPVDEAVQPDVEMPTKEAAVEYAEEVIEEEVLVASEVTEADPQEQYISDDLEPVAVESEASYVEDDAHEPSEEVAAEIEVAETIEESVVEPDSIAAKLQRIRAVVSRNEAVQEDASYTEDEHADAYVAAVANEMSEALNEDDAAFSTDSDYDGDAEVLDALKRLDAAFEPEADEVEDLADDLLPSSDSSGLLEAFADVEEPAPTHVQDEADDLVDAPEDSTQEPLVHSLNAEADAHDDDDPADELQDEDVSGWIEDTLVDDQESDTEVLESEENEALFENLGEIAEDDTEAEMAGNILASEDDEDALASDTLEADLSDEASVELPETSLEIGDGKEESADVDNQIEESPLVLKVNRSEFEAAMSAGELEEVTEEVSETSASSLSPEAEDELMRELAEVEAELEAAADAGQEDLPEQDIEEFETDTDQTVSETLQAAQPDEWGFEDDDDEDLSRLMAAADEKMDGEETASTRDAYNQMRAAVAVTESERSLGGGVEDESADDVYREDLANVVRPRRPVSAGTSPERPATESRPAPLKLVAEQRIDAEAGLAQRGPVRPRRVASTLPDDALGDGDSSFADFVSDMGASELPELLEAAAAYLSFVEGRAQFSRPQLMNKVRQIESGNFNREDGLRSFGRLLREGKIEKTGGGRFTASGDIGFRPDERVAVG